MIVNLISNIFSWLVNLIISPITESIDSAVSAINQNSGVIGQTDLKALLGSAIGLFIPVRAIYDCMAFIIPIRLINLIMSIIIRVKSFIPGMGGK